MAEFTVKRQHLGDRMYLPGDTRQAAESEVAHLIRNGVLQKEKAPKPEKGKAETGAPANKAEGAAPKNKGA
ncbi:hypothetical protein GOB34_14280 [Sinorhizobium meliloti]|nr:hypothetical protein [Sinorhizobium meliloti]